MLNLCLSFMSLYDGGFTSMYSPGVLLVMFATGSLPRPFRRALRINLCVILPYPLVLCLAAAFSPRHATLLRDRSVITAAVQFHFALLATVCFVALLSHIVWSMRRQLLSMQTLGRFQLSRPLGRGPLGDVWVAYHHGLAREVAIKLLRLVDAAAWPRFEPLFAGLSGLTHPNTARVYDFGVSHDGRPYCASELVSGETLRSLIAREGKLNVNRATRVVLQIARSLAEAHARGIAHGNLKPENVFITAGGSEPDFVKVVDYGVAPTGASALDMTPAADVYALGAIFFWLLTGEQVIKDELLGSERAPSPSARLAEPLPDRIESVIVRCLESDPNERFANARELVHALKSSLLLLERPQGEGREPAELSRAQRLRTNYAPDSDETRVEDPDELERRMGVSGEDTESMVSR
jgi:serine/threonine-protein kinase